jgi:hypothetical protein
MALKSTLKSPGWGQIGTLISLFILFVIVAIGASETGDIKYLFILAVGRWVD